MLRLFCIYLLFGVPSFGFFKEATLADFSDQSYRDQVEYLLNNYEQACSILLRPGIKKRVGLKVSSIGREGLSTPLSLVRGVIAALKNRGYQTDQIGIFDQSALHLRQAGYLPPVSMHLGNYFEGCPVFTLEAAGAIHPDWYYENPLPSRNFSLNALDKDWSAFDLREAESRRSYLPVKLFLEVDFWINLPVAMDHAIFGVSGALANMTLWNATNTERFNESPAYGPIALREMSLIPELKEKLAFTMLSLEHYQIAGGCLFNARYGVSEKKLWLSTDVLQLDRLLLNRINRFRKLKKLEPYQPIPILFNDLSYL